MATGRDVSVFFPSVVVNIVSESFEVKVLVYMFLVRTADQKPEEALLSINSFQKDLAHPNPRVRALALRVMSSIRIQVIVPVVILAARKCAVDPSPYVRKSAAHAIPKIYRMDNTRKEELIEIIETMLRDSTPFVLSSAVAAFTEVCPDRIDLLHRHYRKICRMLVDMDEWGQILLSELLLRYARSQFVAPDAHTRELGGVSGKGERSSNSRFLRQTKPLTTNPRTPGSSRSWRVARRSIPIPMRRRKTPTMTATIATEARRRRRASRAAAPRLSLAVQVGWTKTIVFCCVARVRYCSLKTLASLWLLRRCTFT